MYHSLSIKLSDKQQKKPAKTRKGHGLSSSLNAPNYNEEIEKQIDICNNDTLHNYRERTFWMRPSFPGEGVGCTTLYTLYRYVPPQRSQRGVWFLSRFGKTVSFESILYPSPDVFDRKKTKLELQIFIILI